MRPFCFVRTEKGSLRRPGLPFFAPGGIIILFCSHIFLF